jgi:hypothetical protein
MVCQQAPTWVRPGAWWNCPILRAALTQSFAMLVLPCLAPCRHCPPQGAEPCPERTCYQVMALPPDEHQCPSGSILHPCSARGKGAERPS